MVRIHEEAGSALEGVRDGDTILIGGFGSAGQPVELIDALIDTGVGDLEIVSNNAGNGDEGLARLIQLGRVRRIVCSFPRQRDSWHFDAAYRAGQLELEVVPQGNLAERIRAKGAGIAAFFTPTGFGTVLGEGHETRMFDGRGHVLQQAIGGDIALIKASVADRRGNLLYRKTARNFGPVMATAATRTIVQIDHLVETGEIDPEAVVTPSIYVDDVVDLGAAHASTGNTADSLRPRQRGLDDCHDQFRSRFAA